MAIALTFARITAIIMIAGGIVLSSILVAYRLAQTCIWRCWKTQNPLGRSKVLFRFCAQHVESEASSDERFIVYFLSVLAVLPSAIWLIAGDP